MGFLGGGSGSASNTLSNVINFAPSIQTGEDLTSDMTTALDQRASSEATAKDQQSASVGVGVAGGSGSGGQASVGESVLPYADNAFSGASRALGDLQNNTPLLIGAVAVVLLGGALILKKKKRK